MQWVPDTGEFWSIHLFLTPQFCCLRIRSQYRISAVERKEAYFVTVGSFEMLIAAVAPQVSPHRSPDSTRCSPLLPWACLQPGEGASITMQDSTLDGDGGGKKVRGSSALVDDMEVGFNSSAFEALERDFQEVLSELVGDKSLERFRWYWHYASLRGAEMSIMLSNMIGGCATVNCSYDRIYSIEIYNI